jgi:hypothetical protein
MVSLLECLVLTERKWIARVYIRVVSAIHNQLENDVGW